MDVMLSERHFSLPLSIAPSLSSAEASPTRRGVAAGFRQSPQRPLS